jgi:outer membrane protein assembly factor BamC
VGRALEMADLRIDDLNRSLGIYYVDLGKGAQKDGDKPGFFSRLFGSDEASSNDRYQVRLTRVGDSVQVSLEKDADTLAPADISRRVLRQLQENLG